MFSKKADKIENIFPVDLKLLKVLSKRQIDGDDFRSIFVAFLENMSFTRKIFSKREKRYT